MRWHLDDDGFLTDDQGQHVDESQAMEFKESPNTRARREAIQTSVAFANRDGGKVFFGVTNDGLVKGTDMSAKSVENLADEIRDRTYPSLLPPIEEVLVDGKRLVMIDVAAYVPPVVGVYLYSDQPLSQDASVDAGQLQAFVRVGRTNQKEDFMRLRREQRSDPRLRLVVTNKYALMAPDAHIFGSAWVEEDSGTAHNITFRMEPPLSECTIMYPDLPGPEELAAVAPTEPLISLIPPETKPEDVQHEYRSRRAVSFSFDPLVALRRLPSSVKIVARYFDDWGLIWETSRRAEIVFTGRRRRRLVDRQLMFIDGAEFRRRIIALPAKRRDVT